jgi:hypothetical protein
MSLKQQAVVLTNLVGKFTVSDSTLQAH